MNFRDMGHIVINIDWNKNYAAAPQNEDMACVATGSTLDEVKENILSALEFHIEGLKEDGIEIPEEFSGEWDVEWNLSTRALLKYTEKIVPRTAIARASGVNLQQLSHYASGLRHPEEKTQKKIKDGIRSIGNALLAL